MKKGLVMEKKIEKPVLYFDSWDIKCRVEHLIDEECPFEITEDMVDEVIEEFLDSLGQISDISHRFWEVLDELLSNAVFDALYEKAINQINNKRDVE